MGSIGPLMWRSALLLGAIIAGASWAEGVPAQGTGTVSGTVRIVGGEEGVPGVQLEIVGEAGPVITDEEGRFQFAPVSSGSHELRATAVGCAPLSLPVEVAPGIRSTFHLVLDGPAVRSRMAAAAMRDAQTPFTIERIERGQMGRDPGRSIAELIRGAFPGVRVVQGSGVPGSSLSIQFRGPSSISSAHSPLVVIDGVITGGGLDDLDPHDVERIEVLKGAAAAAIYGARGQAGVIEITTRRPGAPAPARCYLRVDSGS